MKKEILKIEKKSIAEELGIEAGDWLISINDIAIVDIFDYRLCCREEYLEVLVEKADGEQWLLEIDKDEDEELGLVFENDLMDNMRGCGNKCLFCFIDQNPPGMRGSLYFKDDDYRLSFLHGNYITLTNMTKADVERILKHRISPINISIHATCPKLRVEMMGNPQAGRSLDFLKDLADGGIALSLQIVLCKGYNDGENLDKTIYDLSRYIPHGGSGCSLAVVPVGLTKYREDLAKLEPFGKEDCQAVIEQVNSWQGKLLKEKGTRFVFIADEFYLKAGHPLPKYDEYEDFLQIDNGIGMLRAFKDEFYEELAHTKTFVPSKKITIATGVAAAPFMRHLAGKVSQDVDVVAIKNDFYGRHITVAGLLTGQDIAKQLADRELGEKVLLPSSCLKAGEDVFLDDMTLGELSQKIGRQVIAVDAEAADFVKALMVQ